MARNGSGTYSLPAGNPVVTGTTISSTWANNTLSDIATALTNSIAKDGQTVPTANLPMGTFKHTGTAVATALTDYARYDQLQNSTPQWLSSVSGADTITASATPTPASYAAGQTFRFISAGANTGAVTLNVSSLGAKAVTKKGAAALIAGDIASGALVEVTYDGAGFHLVSASVTQNGTETLTNKTIDSASNTLTGVVTLTGSQVLTNKTIAASSNTPTGFALQGRQTLPINASAMISRTTNGPSVGRTETATNKIMVSTLDFDQTTAEYAQFQLRMPKSWDEGTVTVSFLWSSAIAGTNSVVWGAQAVALSDDDALDAAFGTAQTVTDAQTAQGDLMQTAETAAITIAGTPAAGDLVVFQFYRDASNGSDSLAGDARLHGATVFYSTDASNDA